MDDKTQENKMMESFENAAKTYSKKNKSQGFLNVSQGIFKLTVSGAILGLGLFYYNALSQTGLIGSKEPDVYNEAIAVKLDKPIGEGKGMINARQFNSLLNTAYQDGNSKGVILEMNSPGGSPVESDIMYERINHYKEKYPEIPVVSVIKDMCASGCYYVASATDKIYASPTSIVGSIGVIMSGFGFDEAIEKLGVERRVYTAGENKAILDPFSKVSNGEKEHIEGMLGDAHKVFIDRVKAGRGESLKFEEYDDIFSGLFWLGDEAKNRGLIDEYASPYAVAEKEFGTEELKFVKVKEPFDISNLLFKQSMGADVIKEAITSSIEEMGQTKIH